MKFRVEVWKREGDELPAHLPEKRTQVHELVVHSSSTWSAAVDAAYGLGLKGEQWMGARPKFVLRVHEVHEQPLQGELEGG